MTKISVFALIGAIATASLSVSAAPINLGESVQLTERNFDASGEWSYETMARRELAERSAWDMVDESEGDLYARDDKPATPTTTLAATSSSSAHTATPTLTPAQKAEEKKAEEDKKKAEEDKKHHTGHKIHDKLDHLHKGKKWRMHKHVKELAKQVKHSPTVPMTASVDGKCTGNAIAVRRDAHGKRLPKPMCCATRTVLNGVCHAAVPGHESLVLKSPAYRLLSSAHKAKEGTKEGIKKVRVGKGKDETKLANKAADAKKPNGPAAKKLAESTAEVEKIEAEIKKMKDERKAKKDALKNAKTPEEKANLKKELKEGKKKTIAAKKELKKAKKESKKHGKAADKEAKKEKPGVVKKMANKLAGKKNGAVSDLVGAAGFKPIATAAFAVAVAVAML